MKALSNLWLYILQTLKEEEKDSSINKGVKTTTRKSDEDEILDESNIICLDDGEADEQTESITIEVSE